jgi:hypothetical protein
MISRRQKLEAFCTLRSAGVAEAPDPTQGLCFEAERTSPSMRNLLEVIERCAELGRKPSDGEPASPRPRTIEDPSRTMQARYLERINAATTEELITDIDIAVVTRHIATVGPHCSRPAYPRHIAQALQLTRAPGRGLLAICLISTKPFVWSRH